jgi:hypothetical protein
MMDYILPAFGTLLVLFVFKLIFRAFEKFAIQGASTIGLTHKLVADFTKKHAHEVSPETIQSLLELERQYCEGSLSGGEYQKAGVHLLTKELKAAEKW